MKNSRDAATTVRTKNKTKKKIQTLIKFTVTEQDICFSSSNLSFPATLLRAYL